MSSKHTLHHTIMRRIYYVYAINTAAHPVLLHGIGMLTMLIALTYFVSIRDVLANIGAVPVARLGAYLYEALMYTEIWTLLLLGGFIFMLFSLRMQLRSHRFSRDVSMV